MACARALHPVTLRKPFEALSQANPAKIVTRFYVVLSLVLPPGTSPRRKVSLFDLPGRSFFSAAGQRTGIVGKWRCTQYCG
jgi:hypothetical protein